MNASVAPATAQAGDHPTRAPVGSHEAKEGRSDRILMIDGLRGVAAMLVVFYHLHEAISRTASSWLWSPLEWIAVNGFLGVDIFFVISGFVIALSVSRGAPTFSYFGRFVLRRSIRLDPPYWTSIAVEVLLLYVSVRLFADLPNALPSLRQLVAHLFYAQELLGYGSIVDVYWTLCYEIQFYAFFVGLVVLRAKLPARMRSSGWTAGFAGALFVLSLWTMFARPEGLPHGLAISRWYQFFIGVLTYFAVTRGRIEPLLLAWAGVAVAIVVSGARLTHVLPILVSGWLVLCARDASWGRLLVSPPLKFLGMISYSIYLFHASVGWRFVSLAQRWLPGPWNAPTALAVYLAGIAVSLACATALWWLVERPCQRLSRRIRLSSGRTAEPASAAAIPAGLAGNVLPATGRT